MAIKEIQNFRFVNLAYYIPRGFAGKNAWWVPRIGVAGIDEAARAAKVNNFRIGVNDITRAELAGISDSAHRMIEDTATRPSNLTTSETVLYVKVMNQQSGKKGSMILPPIKAGKDFSDPASTEYQDLVNLIKNNLSLLVRLPGEQNDVSVPVDYVRIYPRILRQEDAAAAPTVGIDSTDDELEMASQVPAAA